MSSSHNAVGCCLASTILALLPWMSTWAAVRGPVAERVVPLLRGGYVALGSAEGQGLFVLKGEGFDPQAAYLYKLYFLPVDSGVAQVIDELHLGCRLQDRNGKIFVADTVLYLLVRCGNRRGFGYVRNGQRAFSRPFYFDVPNEGVWAFNRRNELVRIWHYMSSWQFMVIRPDGTVKTDKAVIAPAGGFERESPSAFAFLPNDRILCLQLGVAASEEAARKMGLGPARVEWLIHWVVDLKTKQVISHGRDSLSAVDFGSVPGWLSYQPFVRIGGPSDPILYLIQGGMQIRVPGELHEDPSDCRLHLLRFSDEGEVLSPAKAGGEQTRLTSTDRVETPNRIIVSPVPWGTWSALYRIIVLDKDLHLAVEDL